MDKAQVLTQNTHNDIDLCTRFQASGFFGEPRLAIMPRWVWFAPFGALVLALGIWGFRLGWIAATLTETDVILAYTARYLETQGANAEPTDCSARPGRDASVWVLVTCVAQDGARYVYPVDRFGRLLEMKPDAGTPAQPRT